jgi:peptide chain release factor 2
MVKDLRTNYETGNTSAVLDGDLDAFMQAELERLATGGESARGDDRDDRGDPGERATDGEVA